LAATAAAQAPMACTKRSAINASSGACYHAGYGTEDINDQADIQWTFPSKAIQQRPVK